MKEELVLLNSAGECSCGRMSSYATCKKISSKWIGDGDERPKLTRGNKRKTLHVGLNI